MDDKLPTRRSTVKIHPTPGNMNNRNPSLKKSMTKIETDEAEEREIVSKQKMEQVIEAGKDIDSVFLNIVNRLQFYNKRSEELAQSIDNLADQIRKRGPTDYTKTRLGAQTKQKLIIDKQIQTLEVYMREMIDGQAQFNQERDKIVTLYYQQKARSETPGGDIEVDNDLDVTEELAEIDQTIKEIEDIRQRNYKIDDEFLELYQDLFDQYDDAIVTAKPFVEYTHDNPPDWYPDHDIWFNNTDVNVNSNPQADEA